MPSNKRIVKELGDDEGNQTTLHYYNKSLAELTSLANEAIKNMKYDGYRGSFTSKGIPYITHGMVADIVDERYPERQGKYFVDSVSINYDSNGFNREIELGRAATNITGS